MTVDPINVMDWAKATVATFGGRSVLDRQDATALATASVILAASERVKHGHSTTCAKYDTDFEYIDESRPCTCGHDALAALTEGRG